ncbi:hypothetical protein MKX01_033058 [Papaver californicum]|nr:hypothetical protein MKX01_033058 [Papaver californicum]
MQSYFSRLNRALQQSGSGRHVTGVQGPRNTVETLLNREKLTYMMGTLSRTFSTPSVAGPSFQACQYHIDRLVSNSTKLSSANLLEKTSVAVAHGSKSVLRNDHCVSRLASKDGLLLESSFSCRSKTLQVSWKGSMSLKSQEPSSFKHVYGYVLLDVTRRSCNSNPFLVPERRDLHHSSYGCYSAGTAPDVAIDGSAREEQLTSSTASDDQKKLAGRMHTLCVDEQEIGVADDVGEYARELTSNSMSAIQDEPKGSIGIHAINLGDSEFVIVRDGCTHAPFRSSVQQHDFNFTFQLESGTDGDLPSSGQKPTRRRTSGTAFISFSTSSNLSCCLFYEFANNNFF